MQSPAVSSGNASVATLNQLIQAMATVQIEPALNMPSNPVPLTPPVPLDLSVHAQLH
jgi:hypothetical protein